MKLANGTTVPATSQTPNGMSVPVSLLQCMQKYAANIAKKQLSRTGGTILCVVCVTCFC
jgi:hypothetical protein